MREWRGFTVTMGSATGVNRRNCDFETINRNKGNITQIGALGLPTEEAGCGTKR